ncbi:MAG: glycerophosphodiester phosphodiesterase [Clostridiales bacterium]|nr:glycerophosphodiester phosphodiesterase [Clostridiales bacterium]
MIKNIAHRGFSGRYPENTILAFRKAMEEGADGIELDVHLTRDGVPVIIHDERLDRTTNGTGFVKDQTLAQLRVLDAGSAIGSDNGRIPTLEEYLYLVRDAGILTNIELKTDDIPYPGIEQKVITLLKVFDLVDRVIISSFNYETVLRTKSALPEVRCGFLTERWRPEVIPDLTAAGIEYLHPWYGCVTPERMAEAKDCGIGVNTWTVNEEADIREMLRMGVDAVITNYPDRVNRVKNELCGD